MWTQLTSTWSLVLIGMLNSYLANGEIFTAMSDVESLIESEGRVVQILRNVVQAERRRLSIIEDYIKEFADLYEGKSAEETMRIVSHPINAFLLVKRLGVEWPKIGHLLATNLASVGLEEIERERSMFPTPDSEEDMKGASEAIVRLQHTYRLDENQMASGRLPGITTYAPALTALDCYLLGYHQAQMGFHDYAQDWLRIALNKYDDEVRHDVPQKIQRAQILDWLQHSVYNFGNVSRALSIARSLQEIAPDFPNVQVNTVFYEELINNMSQKSVVQLPQAPPSNKMEGGTYEALCRGEGTIDPSIERNFRCYFETYQQPWMLLQPVKTEIVFQNPDIFILHDIVTASQIDRVKQVGKNYLRRAQVVKPGTDEFEPARIRISKSAFLREDMDPIVAELNKRIGMVTNMNMQIAEDLQLANYGIGGHYDPHFDHFRTMRQANRHQLEERIGDRIATFLLYMTDVDAGGATVFPRINITLFPEKGSAAFWFNLHRDGLGDENTLHAGCPVLAGNKWISNKWIREKWQDISRPCALQPDSPEWVDGWPDEI